MYKTITNYVLGLGIRPTSKGFRYMIDAINIATKHKGVKINMLKEIYSPIAIKYDDTPSCVERALRYAIHNSADEETKTMSVSEFLAKTKIENKFKGE